MTKSYKLYGMAASLYTAKVRAYMRQNHVPFSEHKAGDPHFLNHIKAQIGRWIIPVIETPEGDLIQDGTDILDYFENEGYSQKSIFPQTPVMRVIAHLFELFGGVGLLRPAMHYRWNFDETNLAFLKYSFRDTAPNGLPPEETEGVLEMASGRMRMATVALGVTPETQDLVESAYKEFLDLLSDHLRERPFLLGGYAAIGDFAMLGPLYAHLARDPAPLHLMQTTAPRVHRWTERMNAPEVYFDEEFAKAGGELIDDHAVPDTLKALMKYISEEYLPEIEAHVAFANSWLSERPNIEPGTSGTEKQNGLSRPLGMASFEWRGKTISTVVLAHRFVLLQRIQDSYTNLHAAQQKEVRDLFAETGLEPILDLKTSRRVERMAHLEVWGERQQEKA